MQCDREIAGHQPVGWVITGPGHGPGSVSRQFAVHLGTNQGAVFGFNMDQTVHSSLTFPDRQAVSRIGLAKGVGCIGPTLLLHELASAGHP